MTVKQNPACCKQTKGFRRAKIFPTAQVKLQMSIVFQLLLDLTRVQPRFFRPRSGQHIPRKRERRLLDTKAGSHRGAQQMRRIATRI
jgi:hypothetical protein